MPTKRDKLALASDVVRYLASGKYDPGGRVLSGSLIPISVTEYSSHLREALLVEVRRLEQEHPIPAMPEGLNPEAFVRNKLYSLVKGLFSTRERENVMGMLVDTMVLMTPENARLFIQEADLSTAWKAADFYLASLGSPGLSGRAEHPVVLDVGDARLISVKYFDDEALFVDHLVHEAARMVCSARRGAAGLRQTKNRVWLIDVVPARHRMFAHACEVYSRLRERSRGPVQRRKILREYAGSPQPGGRQVERVELLRILDLAVDVRDGWKRILVECSEQRHGRLKALRWRPPHGRTGRTEPGVGQGKPDVERRPVVQQKVTRGRIPHLSTTANPPGKGGTLPYNPTPLSISWKPAAGRTTSDAEDDAPTQEVHSVGDEPCPLPDSVPFGQQVQFMVGERRRMWGTVTVISEEGLCLQCSERVMEREKLRIFLSLPAEMDQGQRLHLVYGKVIWRRNRKVMVLFEDLKWDVVQQLRRLVRDG